MPLDRFIKTTKRSGRLCILIGLLISMLLDVSLMTAHAENSIAQLLKLIYQENKTSPLHPLGNFTNSTDLSLHAANLAYLKENDALLGKIRADLGDQSIRWQISSLSSRLLYVPENRPEYIELYEDYCRRIIDEILILTQLPNPYEKIITLDDTPPELHSSKGFHAYIVHNLASEVRAKYEFQNAYEQTVSIELTSHQLSGEVGSYSSYLSFDATGNVVFTRNQYTVWQNSAKNPYTALMTPVEETLHIVLRENTELAIKSVVENQKIQSAQNAMEIVEDWISVEEALVGGLVYHLLPPILEKQIDLEAQALVSKDLETKSNFSKYRFLNEGIRLVNQLGYELAIKLYQEDPIAFRKLL